MTVEQIRERSSGVGFVRMDWLYFTVTDSDGSTRLVVRRNGPKIQLLTPNGWVDRPQLFPRFLDPGFLEETPAAEARAAAVGNGLNWPTA